MLFAAGFLFFSNTLRAFHCVFAFIFALIFAESFSAIFFRVSSPRPGKLFAEPMLTKISSTCPESYGPFRRNFGCFLTAVFQGFIEHACISLCLTPRTSALSVISQIYRCNLCHRGWPRQPQVARLGVQRLLLRRGADRQRPRPAVRPLPGQVPGPAARAHGGHQDQGRRPGPCAGLGPNPPVDGGNGGRCGRRWCV